MTTRQTESERLTRASIRAKLRELSNLRRAALRQTSAAAR